MRPRNYSSEGIVLGRKNYGEADRILSIYSLEFGRGSYLAKGIRKPESRKRGNLEIFSQIKFEAAGGKGINILTEVEMIDDFQPIRKSLHKIALSYYLMEVTGKITHEQEKNPELYYLILKYINKIKENTKLKKIKREFIIETLELLGYWPKGKELKEPDTLLEEVIERQLTTVRVGKRVLNSL